MFPELKDTDWVAEAAKEGVEGFLHPSELYQLMELATDREVLEVGSFRGLSAWGMAQTAKSVVCVDTFKANSAGQVQMEDYTTLDDFLAATARFTNVDFLPVTSEKAIEVLPAEKTFDFIFIDAMHEYDDVKADILRWLPRLRQDGVLALHDYRHLDFPGVQQAVDEVLGPPANVVVTLAWFHRRELQLRSG